MKIGFDDVGTVRVDNVKFCYWELGNDREDIPAGSYPVEARFSHVHDVTLPFIEGVGLVGFTADCAIVIGQVRHRVDVIGCSNTIQRLVACIETADETGRAVTAEIA